MNYLEEFYLILSIISIAVSYKIPNDVQRDNGECEWSWEAANAPSFPPLVLDSKNDNFLPKGKKKKFSVDKGDVLTFSCPGKKNKLETYKEKVIQVKCAKSGEFKDENSEETYIDGNAFNCQKPIKEELLTKANSDDEDVKCGKDEKGIKVVIKFDPEEDKFDDAYIDLITVCFNMNLRTSLWTNHILYGKNFEAHYKRVDRHFKADEAYFPENIKEFYEQKNQPIAMKELGIDEDIIKEDRRYLQQGHLSPIADFITTAEMKATNHMINVVPQWNAINSNGNWQKIEKATQDLAKKGKGVNIEIYTGGYGILKLDDKKVLIGKNKATDKEPNIVPVPEVLWKVLLVKLKTKTKAVAIFVANNPFLEEKPVLLCEEDICHELNWLEDDIDLYQRHEFCHGYTYCCNLDQELIDDILGIPEEGPFELLLKK